MKILYKLVLTVVIAIPVQVAGGDGTGRGSQCRTSVVGGVVTVLMVTDTRLTVTVAVTGRLMGG